MKYYLIAGEASGDLHASHLMSALKQQDQSADFRFFGGDMMAAVGGTLVMHYHRLAYMGFLPVLLHLPEIVHNITVCEKDIASFAPDVVILVDYPGFNMKIAKFVKEQLQIPVYYYIPPKIWAWKEYRIKGIRKYVDKVYSILPFEVAFYQKHHFEIDYVGNPSLDEIADYTFHYQTKKSFLAAHQLPDRPIVVLMAGSRKQEIRSNLNIMLGMQKYYPDYQFVIAGAPGISLAFYEQEMNAAKCTVLFNQTYELLHWAHAAFVTSGTATLETALLGVPQVVCYYAALPPWLFKLMRPLIKTKFVSLVNLISEKEVCKELLGYLMTDKSLKEEADRLIYDSAYRNAMRENYQYMKQRLGGSGAPKRAAKSIYQSLTERRNKE